MSGRRSKRREFLGEVGRGAAAMALGGLVARPARAASGGTTGAADRPNFLVFLTDDLGWGDPGCYGGTVVRTPNLDRFRTEGVKLDACYAGYAICQPSRVAMMTGRVPNRVGVPSNKVLLADDVAFFAKYLREAGYATAHVGKWHLAATFHEPAAPGPNLRGFDHFFGDNEQDKGDDPKNPRIYDPTNIYTDGGKAVGPLKGHPTTIFVDEAIRWLREDRPKDKPFYMNLWTHAPHGPHATIPEFEKEYAGRKDPMYWQSIAHLDREFGRLLGALDDLGLRETTLVMFTSDNGPTPLHPGSSGPYRGGKFVCYEGGVRVPGLVRWPGHIAAGSESEEPVAFVDLQPTFCALAGATVPGGRYDGANVQATLTQGKAAARPVPLFWHTIGDRYMGAPPMVAMIEEPWKIVTDPQFQKVELYDLGSDPGEKTSLAQAEPARAQAMLARCRTLFEEIEAEGAQHRAKAKSAKGWPQNVPGT
jgi:arylsulfatase A-like enzyme